MRAPIAILAPLLATILLAGCTTPDPDATASPPSTEAPTVTPTPTATPAPSGPTPRFDLSCADLVPPSSSAFVSAIEPRDPIATYAAATGSLPRLSSIQAIGGLVCEWSNGVAQASIVGAPSDYAGVLVSILPAATEQWARYATVYGITESRKFYCVDQIAYCGDDQIVGEYWLTAEVHGVADNGAVDSALAAMGSLLSGLPASRPVRTPPTGTIPLSSDCTALVALTDVAAAFGLDEVVALRGHGGWSQYAGAEEDLSMPSCSWGAGGEERGPGGIAAVPGGASQGSAYLSVATSPTTATPLQLDELASGDSAWQRCSDSICYVDLIAGGNWIQFRVSADQISADLGTATSALAGAVLRTLYG